MDKGFPCIIVGRESKLIGRICPICKKYFLFGDRLCILSRKGIYAHNNCVEGGKKQWQTRD